MADDFADQVFDFIDTFIELGRYLLFDVGIPLFHSLIPGHSTFILNSFSYSMIMLFTLTIIAYTYYKWWID